MMCVRLRNLGSLYRLTASELLQDGLLNEVTHIRRNLHKKPSSIFDKPKKAKVPVLQLTVVKISLFSITTLPFTLTGSLRSCGTDRRPHTSNSGVTG